MITLSMRPTVNRVLLVVLILFVVATDQWTKHLAREHLPFHERHYAGVLSLVYVENEGAFLSLGSNLPRTARVAIFTVAVGLAVVVALFLLLTARVHGLDAVAVALIGAGGIGNLIDRLARHGRVTDFLLLSAGPGLVSPHRCLQRRGHGHHRRRDLAADLVVRAEEAAERVAARRRTTRNERAMKPGERTFLSAAVGRPRPTASAFNDFSGRTGMSGRCGQECPLSTRRGALYSGFCAVTSGRGSAGSSERCPRDVK